MPIPKLLMMAGMGVGAAGQIQAGRAAAAEAKSAERISAYNAAVMEREAKAIRKKGAFEQTRQAKHAARVMGTLRADLAGQGAYGGGLLEEEQEAELELENLLIGYEAETAARRAESQAEIDRATGRLAKERGKAGRQAGYLGAGATLLTGFGMAGMYGKTPKTGAKWSDLTPREKYRYRSGGMLNIGP
jgi:hypothetical protein